MSGGEASGVVEEVGDGVTGVAPGDRVAFAQGASAYAEYVAVPAWKLVPIPENIGSDIAAATMLHVQPERITPMAVPLMVIVGREALPPGAEADETLLTQAEALAGAAMHL